jgi:formylglycine-generating enzyme required for sulfatase activity
LFVYTPPVGTKLNEGLNQDLKVAFTPVDAASYNTLNKTVNINVNKPIIPVNLPMVNIPAGTFSMGSPNSEVARNDNEVEHQVTLSAFRMSKYEITNAQYATFLNAKSIGSNGLYASGAYPAQSLVCTSSGGLIDKGLHYTSGQWVPVASYENHPVIYVTWYGATEFATYAGGRLPTEAEWEYACRGNTITPINTGNCLSDAQANYDWSSQYSYCTNTITTRPNSTQAVGTYPANAYGLHDMHGNVWEWCSDWKDAYPTAPQTNPTGAASGSRRVIRGGSWYNYAMYCRSALRADFYPNSGNIDIGFRVVLVP